MSCNHICRQECVNCYFKRRREGGSVHRWVFFVFAAPSSNERMIFEGRKQIGLSQLAGCPIDRSIVHNRSHRLYGAFFKCVLSFCHQRQVDSSSLQRCRSVSQAYVSRSESLPLDVSGTLTKSSIRTWRQVLCKCSHEACEKWMSAAPRDMLSPRYNFETRFCMLWC